MTGVAEQLDRLREAAGAAAQHAEQAAVAAQTASEALVAAELAVSAASMTGIDPFVFRLAIFVMAIFVGYYVVWSVTPALHTPLMAVTNAISSVIVVGALLAVGVDVSQGINSAGGWAAKSLGFGALILASINIVGGFMVTQRMLAMYKKKIR
ncbi:MAG: NAD(P) transhydrogenase subunit alpha [Chromatiales bacterium]|jgi:H+-translocating NAD(P) transhydrogenase subunit alpha|nr:NAD(P) transhydrogenase subunit alpha [Chromatiales bacterium]